MIGIILPMTDKIKAGIKGILKAIRARGKPPLNSNIGSIETKTTITPG